MTNTPEPHASPAFQSHLPLSSEVRSPRHRIGKRAKAVSRSSLRPALAAALIATISASTSKGADGIFNPAGNANWSDTSHWVGGVVANGSGAEATLRGARGHTISLDTPVVVGSLVLDGYTATGVDNRWILSGGGLTFDSGEAGVKSLIDLGNASNPGTAQRLDIESIISGSSGLEIRGGALSLTGTANTFTGGIDLKGRLLVAGAGSLNGNSIHISRDDSAITFGRTTEVYSSDITLAADGSQLLARGLNASVILSGNIGEEGGQRDLILSQAGVALAYFRLRGNNSYTGDTIIGRSGNDSHATVIQAESDNAFGAGASTISFAGTAARTNTSDAVWLNGVTITDKKIVLRGSGYGGAGSLRARTASNTWAGEVHLGTVSDASIGVDSGATLTVTGAVTGSAAGGLHKVGAGTLILTGNNSYSTGTLVKAGKLVAAHANALGTGEVSLEGSTILEIAAGTQLNVSALSITSNSQLAFNLESLAFTSLTVTGDLTGAETLTISISGTFSEGGTYTLLQVGGSTTVTSFLPDSPLPDGSILDWNSETNVLTLTVIPEASTTTMLALGILAGAALLARGRRGKDTRLFTSP